MEMRNLNMAKLAKHLGAHLMCNCKMAIQDCSHKGCQACVRADIIQQAGLLKDGCLALQ